MAIARHFAISVGTSATGLEGTQYPGWVLKNNGAATVFIGDGAVTTATGFPIAAGDIFAPSELSMRSLRGLEADKLYGIVASGTVDVRIVLPGRVNA